jgi:hypothetical protein
MKAIFSHYWVGQNNWTPPGRSLLDVPDDEDERKRFLDSLWAEHVHDTSDPDDPYTPEWVDCTSEHGGSNADIVICDKDCRELIFLTFVRE